MSKYFSVDGYWKDDKVEFEGNIIKEFDDAEESEELDDMIFFYGLDEEEIKKSIEQGEEEDEENGLEFVITSYVEINFPN